MIFDTHAHYDDEAFDTDRSALLAAMPAQGVGLILDPGCDMDSSRRAMELARQFPHVYAAVGWHPENCAAYTEESLNTLRMWAQEYKVAAIGEIGLDYHYEDIPREIQKNAFRMQLALARELSMPVVVHEREAHEDGMRIIDEFPEVKGVFHCYSGSLEMAKELVKRGWYIGFTGVITFKNARKAVEVAEWLPLSRTLIETDCPYMAPEPFRGRRCDPSMVPQMAKKIAEIKGLAPEAVAQATFRNAVTLFRLDAAGV